MSVVTMVATVVALLPTTVLASGSPLETETFANNSTAAGQWSLPAGSGGTNQACLTAGPVSATTSIPNCASPPDSSGNGALRLTTNAGNAVGAVFYQASLPTTQGLDVTLDTYQFDGSGADGIVFTLAAADPADPTPPASTGPLGGNLGYAAASGGSGAAGMPYGYLGIGLDVYGNYENTPLAGGSGCTIPSPLVTNRAYPESVTARGPGNGSVGYCILGTTATTWNQSSGGGSGNGSVSNLGPGLTLDNQSATSRTGVMVPVEMAINPSASATTTASGLSVPATSWLIAYTPLGTTTQQTLTGALPTTSNNAALATFPGTWINPATKIPYQLTFGWTASTGGSNEYHEVNQLVATTLIGAVPDLALTKSDNENGHMVAGNHANFILAPSVSASGGSEANQLTVTDTLPNGMTPGTATSSSDWSCGTVTQTVTCTYTPASAIAAGTALPNITIPVTLALSLSGTVTNTARMSSTDGLPAVSNDAVNVTAFTASALPSPQTYLQPVTYASMLPTAVSGTVTFTIGATTLCTAALPAVSCTATNAPVGTDSVTATYSGDSTFAPQTTTTTVTIVKATPSFSEAAAPSSIPFGTQDTLSASGLPAGASGTVTFSSGGSTLCVATIPTTSCQTAATLSAGTYPVTATYSGDGSYTSAIATGASFTVTQLTTSMTESTSPPSIPHGTADTLSVSGLPGGATGTVTFKSGGSTLCVAALPATSCATPTTLIPSVYPVTATYSGDVNYVGTTATGASFTVTQASTTMTESAAPSSVPYGTSDTLSVSGLPVGATGTVTFVSGGGSTLCVATLASTSCTTSTTLVPGTYPVTATYSGDGNYTGTTATGASFAVTKADTSMTESASPPSIGYGSQDTLSVTGLPAVATGTVTFKSGGAALCVAVLPVTSCQTSTTLAPGAYPVTATYSGDSDYNGSTTTGASFTVTKTTPSFSESAAPSSVPYGTADTVSVTGLPVDATGTVTFTSGGPTLCVATIPATSCLTSATLAPGPYPVTATYSGDSNYTGAIATGASFTVTQADTSMTEFATPASIAYGSSDTVSATGLPVDATGTVTFTSGGSTLCVATLPLTSCQTSATLAPATYPVTATYSGDANYNGSTATGASFTVTRADAPFTDSAAPSTVPYGTADTVSVAGLPVDATGTVTFTFGGTTLCVVTLTAISCQTSSTLAAGTYPVTATYSGDANYNGGVATGASFTVTRADPPMTEFASPATISYGTQDTLSATGVPLDATGTVTFTSGGSTICTATLPATSCQTSMTLAPGSYPVTATYSGDGNYDGSTATGANFTVTKATVTLDESASPITIVFGTADTVSASGLPDSATGTLTFTSGSRTLCVATLPATSCTTSVTLNPALYPVTATYSGDTNDTPATASTAQFTVIKADTAIVVDVNPKAATPGSPITVWVTGLPTGVSGTVTFTSGGSVLCTATLPAVSCTTSMDLPPGSYPVTATYSGDDDYNGSTAIGSGQLGVLSIVTDPTVPTTGAGQNGQGIVVGSIMVLAGTTTVVMSRRIRRRQHRPA
jgi:hypothetical protein